MAAWQAETLIYGKPFTMRTGFTGSPKFRKWIASGRRSLPAIRGCRWTASTPIRRWAAGNGAAAEALASRIEAGCDAELRADFIHFAVRAGARRAADAATCLARAGYAGLRKLPENRRG